MVDEIAGARIAFDRSLLRRRTLPGGKSRWKLVLSVSVFLHSFCLAEYLHGFVA